MLDLNNPKVALIYGALTEALGKHDVTKIKDYFTDDAILIINEKKLQRHEMDERLTWIKNHTKSVTVKVHNVFFDGDQGFDYHTTEMVDEHGKRALFKIFGYIKLRAGKICHYEDVTIQLEGQEAMAAVTATTN